MHLKCEPANYSLSPLLSTFPPWLSNFNYLVINAFFFLNAWITWWNRNYVLVYSREKWHKYFYSMSFWAKQLSKVPLYVWCTRSYDTKALLWFLLTDNSFFPLTWCWCKPIFAFRFKLCFNWGNYKITCDFVNLARDNGCFLNVVAGE